MPQVRNSYNDRSLDEELDRLNRRIKAAEVGQVVAPAAPVVQQVFAATGIQMQETDGSPSFVASVIEIDQTTGLSLTSIYDRGKISRTAATTTPQDVGSSASAGTSVEAANKDHAHKIRDSAAVSVIGRSANSTGAPADIAAGGNGQYLQRNSNVVSFAAIASADLPAHHTTHESGGSDAIQLDNLAAPDDNTDLNVSTTKHGLTPKLPNDVTKYLDGTGAYSVPPGSGGIVRFMLPAIWYKDNVPGGTYTGIAPLDHNGHGTGLPGEIMALRAGYVSAIGVASNAARTAGSITLRAVKNDSTDLLSVVLDGTNTTYNVATGSAGTFAAKDLISVQLDGAGWTPTTADIWIWVEITYS